jgi:hypothetical protein
MPGLLTVKESNKSGDVPWAGLTLKLRQYDHSKPREMYTSGQVVTSLQGLILYELFISR